MGPPVTGFTAHKLTRFKVPFFLKYVDIQKYFLGPLHNLKEVLHYLRFIYNTIQQCKNQEKLDLWQILQEFLKKLFICG